MANVNRFFATGNLTREPELSITKGGKTMLKFGLAVNEKQAQREHVNFFDCVIWGKYGETMQRYLHKGQRVAIAGNLHYDSWSDPVSGYKRSRIEVYVREIDTLGPPPARDPQEYASGEQLPVAAAPTQVPDPPAEVYDEDIPF
ncbi:MAG: single-stranded DNA-binding protein [Atopobiaceae bacterium]|nr:single-stranded DNA-binding protein [Atopobiaceae bacterium]